MPCYNFLLQVYFILAATITSALAFSVTPSTPISRRGASCMYVVAAPTRISEEPTFTIDRTIERKEESLTGRSEWWELKLFNDPENYDYYVAECLVKVAQISELHAYRAMRAADTQGQAVIGTYSFERAEWYTDALKAKGLVVDMFPIDYQ